MTDDFYYSPPYEEETVDRMLPRLLKRADVAHLLRISDKSLRALIRSGKIKPILIGNCERFRESDICRLIERG